MTFQNIRTGNIIESNDKSVIALMSKQTDTYKSYKSSTAEKPVEASTASTTKAKK